MTCPQSMSPRPHDPGAHAGVQERLAPNHCYWLCTGIPLWILLIKALHIFDFHYFQLYNYKKWGLNGGAPASPGFAGWLLRCSTLFGTLMVFDRHIPPWKGLALTHPLPLQVCTARESASVPSHGYSSLSLCVVLATLSF